MEKGLYLCKLPIQFLQDNLYGILRGDLIMIAAQTGFGKSTLGRLFANQAIAEGVPVVIYSLEDEPVTFEKKMAYKFYCQRVDMPMPFRQFKDQWEDNTKFVPERQKVADVLMQTSPDGLPMITVWEMKTPAWTLDSVLKQMEKEVAKGHKFFIFDHFDKVVEDNANLQRAGMDKLWDFVAQHKVALITFSQLRQGRNQDSLCPGLDDLRGSRAKVNNPTIVLSIAKHNYNYYSAMDGHPTYCRILKDRDEGKAKCAVIFFKNDGYLTNYREVECNPSGSRIDGETMKSLEKVAK